jgi:hypothetical protein
MKRIFVLCVIVGLLLSGRAVPVSADDDVTYKTALWLGGHHTNFTGYPYGVSEYNLITDEPIPEFMLDFERQAPGQRTTVKGYFFDKYNANLKATSTFGDRLSAAVRYRSLLHNVGRDLLANLSAREYLGGGMIDDPTSDDPADSIEAGGGKMLTHELADDPVEYREKRHEISSDVNLLLTRTGNLRLIAAHKSIIERGHEQQVSVMHCFSCHVTSKTAEIDKQTHQINAGLEGEVSAFYDGYRYGYRTFSSNAEPQEIAYDDAKHPVHGGAAAEFGSRQIYDGETITYGLYPDIEKMSHKVRLTGDIPGGRLASAFTYSTVENSRENYAGVPLKAESYGGHVNYATSLSARTRLIAKAAGRRVKNNDPFIDLPTWRDYEGAAGPTEIFDSTRFSSLDRREIEASAKVVARLTRKLRMSAATGIENISRYDYPDSGADYATTKLFGEVGMKYREGLSYSLRGNYRYEHTTDPFVSGRGLFELRGREALQLPYPGFRFAFYYQREDLRYQDITTIPTDRHELELMSTYHPDNNVNIAFGFKTSYDKNGELDSLDVEHFMFQPNLNVSITPHPQWTLAGGSTYGYYRSRGPVTVALFDG